ncbi:glycosyltransferase [Helicobacter sp. 13S00477-4]|uniref:glycosyltransferase n=1 Tax=Helicobacter sp. 13S00477-4 TaxID=1905759 RepID=UPI000BA5CE63|nr:glycosyltransferase [Helicobacter sp. 13S00477-4]PAF51936.1 hypothetical protein BKH44_04540 [Helicobacter sp. 13S00477-4]
MNKIKDLEFCLLGKTDDNTSSVPLNQIRKWEKEGLISYGGMVKDIRKYIENASCIVLPSYYREGVPRILLEAMAMEKPIITTNTAGCKETICNGKQCGDLIIGDNGILCEAKNTTSLKNALEYFLNLSKEQHLKMGKAGREFVKKFDVNEIIKIYKNKLDIKKPIIAFVSNTSFGMYNFRLEVLRELKKQGFIIHILSPKDEYTNYFNIEGFFHHPIKINSKGLNPIEDLKTFFQIKKILKSISPSMTFTYTIKPVIYGSLVCRILKIPHISIITGLGYAFIEGGVKKKILLFLISNMYKISLKHNSEIWFLNHDDELEFLKRKITLPSKTFLINSEGINLKHFFINQTNTKSNKITFLLAARMLWDKGVKEFIQAAKMIKQQ